MTPLEEAFVKDPPSEEICKRLNTAGAIVCEHGRNPCYLRCGVRSLSLAGKRWQVIPYAERAEWLEAVNRHRLRLERFLGEFPDNATCWSQATSELPDMYRWISDDGKRFPPVGRENCHTPAEWNQKYKAAIREGYAKLNYPQLIAFEERFVEWLKPKVGDC